MECRFEQTFVRFLERIHKVHFIDRETFKGKMWSRRRLTKIQATSRPDQVCPEVWTKIGKAAQNREKQEWGKEKPKLDNARILRGIYFVDPDDEEYREILKNARRKLERPKAPAMPCKRSPNGITKVTAKPEIAGRLIFSLPLLSPDAVRPWTCAWPPPLQRQPAGDAAQAAFARKQSYYRKEIGELRQQNIHHRPLVWSADGRPHPAVTRTLQYVAGHRLQSKRARNPNRSPAMEGSSPESFSEGRVALRRYHRQSAPLGTRPRS